MNHTRSQAASYRLAVSFTLIAFAATAACYCQLPDSVPMHWDLHGRPTLYLSKWWAAWLLPVATAIVTTGLMWLLAPKRTSSIIVNGVAGLMCYICTISLYTAIRPLDSLVPYAFMGIGVFLMVVGNILGKLTWNFFVGIRTYWTMDDPSVWERTHRAAGPVYVLGGTAILIAGLTRAPTSALFALLLATCVYPVIHSYIAWRRG
jgi:uncharacterized membrane protein